jgi:hypothetical protein
MMHHFSCGWIVPFAILRNSLQDFIIDTTQCLIVFTKEVV